MFIWVSYLCFNNNNNNIEKLEFTFRNFIKSYSIVNVRPKTTISR